MRAPDFRGHDEGSALDPATLALALWLGLVVGVTGMVRLSNEAALQAELSRERTRAAPVASAAAPSLI